MMGFFQLRTAGVMFFTRMGLRNTVPSRIERIWPLGEGQAFLSLYSVTRSASGVIVAHFTPTPYCWMACADSVVIRSSVSSRFRTPRS